MKTVGLVLHTDIRYYIRLSIEIQFCTHRSSLLPSLPQPTFNGGPTCPARSEPVQIACETITNRTVSYFFKAPSQNLAWTKLTRLVDLPLPLLEVIGFSSTSSEHRRSAPRSVSKQSEYRRFLDVCDISSVSSERSSASQEEHLLCAKIGAIAWRHLAVPVDHLLAGTVVLTLLIIKIIQKFI